MYVKTIQLEKPTTADYARHLRLRNIKFVEVDQYYYQVGNIKGEQGWIIHLSVIKDQIQDLLNTVIPELLKEKIAFKVIKDAHAAEKVLSGALGYAQVGKIVRIYPESIEKALPLIDRLITLTRPFKGPFILTDSHLAGIVYTRYGAFNPITGPNANGQTERYIHDTKGNLVADANEIPFRMPAGIKWPFPSFSIAPVENPKTLHNRYMIRTELRTKAKGRVLKAYSVRGLLIKSCVIKESKYAMCDEIGRDLRERLQWQRKLHNTLQHSIRIPKVFDFFEDRGNTYLAMELIKGRSLQEGINLCYLDANWPALDRDKKIKLIDLFSEILKFVEALHQQGYVHRDLTAENFMLDQQGKLVMIDLELSYDLTSQTPSPPYRLGTLGYMSPEQLNTETPTVKEDIYAVGALMIVFFANSSPAKFNVATVDDLRAQLAFFIGEQRIVDLIAACLSRDPALRPSLLTVSDIVQSWRAEILSLPHSSPATSPRPTNEKIQDTIEKVLSALTTPAFVSGGNPWHSNAMDIDDATGDRHSDYQYYPGLYAGVSGVLNTVSLAQQLGVRIDNQLRGLYTRNYKYLHRSFLSLVPNVPPGLYQGSAGAAVCLVSGTKARLIPLSQETKTLIRQCLQLPGIGLDLAQGSAGQGLAILQAKPLLGDTLAATLLKPHLTAILEAQRSDGSWSLDNEKKVDLSHGIAGIVYFLLEYDATFGDNLVQTAAIKGLDYLKRQAKRANGKIFWRVSDRNTDAKVGVAYGFTGVALSFMKGYAQTHNAAYKAIAEEALRNYGRYPMGSDLSLATGLSGTGEAYMEAYLTFGNDEWLHQADWIASQLVHTVKHQPDGSAYWVMTTNQFPSADVSTGNCGPLRFLLRYNHAKEIGLPLLNA